jgi:2-polyprenyl-3-methyl-5-hydroxy-6-metoxy-1,4-benzoquinol methylase
VTGDIQTGRSEYYDSYWKTPELEESVHLRWKVSLTRNHPRLETAKSILDVGCAGGQMLSALRAPGRRLCGVEINESAIEAVRARGIEGHVVDLENSALPFGPDEFDVVLCYDVIEHVFAPMRVLGEIARVVRPAGFAFIAVPNTLNVVNRLIFLSGKYVDVMDIGHRSEDLFSDHIRLFSKDLFERALHAAKLDVVERHNYFPDRFTDPKYKLPSWLTRLVTVPRLHEHAPSLFALGFLYVCQPKRT